MFCFAWKVGMNKQRYEDGWISAFGAQVVGIVCIWLWVGTLSVLIMGPMRILGATRERYFRDSAIVFAAVVVFCYHRIAITMTIVFLSMAGSLGWPGTSVQTAGIQVSNDRALVATIRVFGVNMRM